MHRARAAILLSAGLGACAGASMRPDSLRAEDLPVVSLAAEETQEVVLHAERAVEALVRRRYDEAESEAGAALDLDPRCARARAVLGLARFHLAATADPRDLFVVNAAEAEILCAGQLAPEDAFVGWVHAVFLADCGHMSAAAAAAEAALTSAVAAPPGERAALLGVAGTYRYELGEERAALAHLQAYIALQPEDAAATFRIGNCLLRIAAVPQGPRPTSLLVAQSNAEAAARAFARCAELVPGDEDAALAVGAANLRAAELAEERGDAAARDELRAAAEQQFRAVAEQFRSSAEAMFRVGVAAEVRGTDDAAREAYSQALARAADHLGSLLNLAALSERTGAEDGAAVRGLLERALAVDAARGGLTADERRRITERLRAGA